MMSTHSLSTLENAPSPCPRLIRSAMLAGREIICRVPAFIGRAAALAVALFALTFLPAQHASAQLRTFEVGPGAAGPTDVAPGERINVVGLTMSGGAITDEPGLWEFLDLSTFAGSLGTFDNANSVRTVYTASELVNKNVLIRFRIHTGTFITHGARTGERAFNQVGTYETVVRVPADAGAPSFADTAAIVHPFDPGDPVNLTLPAATGGDGGQVYTLIHRSGETLAELGLTFNGFADIRTLRGTLSDAAPPQTSEFTFRAQDRDATTTAADRADLTLRIQIAALITFGGDTTGAITEDAATDEVTGTLIVTNPNPGGNLVVARTNADGGYGLFSIGADGAWTYTLGGNDANRNALNRLHGNGAGEMVMDRFTVTTAADSTATQDIVITITGANDAPTARITGLVGDADVEFGSTVRTAGNNSGDPDFTGTILTYAWSTDPPDTGSFAFPTATNSDWTAPSDGPDQVTIILTVTDNGTPPLSDTDQVTVNLVAVAVDFAGSETTGAVTEDDSTDTATGALTIATSSSNQNVVVQTDTPGAYGSFTITAAGAWTYTLDNTITATNALVAGATVDDTFTVTASVNPDATVDVVITITGANDAPTAEITAPPANTMVSFAGTIPVTGAGEDPDTGDNANLTYAWTTVPANTGSFANATAADTTWSAPSTEMSVALHLRVSDDATPAATADATPVTVMVVPVAIVGDTTGSVTEDGDLTATGDLNIDNPTPGSDTTFTADDQVGTYGAFTIAANGTWSYTLLNTITATNALAAGDAPTETFTATAAAGSTQVITITVNGANDAPTAAISAPAPNAQVQFGTAVTVTGTGTDPDTGDTANLTYRWTAATGSFADDTAASTTWTAPASGTAPVTLTLTVMDDATPPLTGTAQVMVNPVAVAVTFGGSVTTGAVTEDSGTAVGGALTVVTTSTNKNVVAQTGESGTYGTFSITAPGAWTYTLDNNNAATNALPGGQVVTDTFTVTASVNPDATVDVVITITGANDAPEVTISAPTPPMTGTFSVVSGRQVTLRATATDPDFGATMAYAWTTSPANQGTFASETSANTTWDTPPTVTGDTPVTLTLTVSDNAPSNPATGTATFDLTVTIGPSVSGNGVDADNDPATTADNPLMLTPATFDAATGVTTGGIACGMLMVSNIPTDQSTGNPSTVVHRITEQPPRGIVTLVDDCALTSNVGDNWNYQLDNSRDLAINLGPTDSATDSFGIETTVGDITINSVISVSLPSGTFPDDSPIIIFEGGPSMTVDEGEMVTLDASGSRDPEDGQGGLGFTWTHTATDDVSPDMPIEDTDAVDNTFTFMAPDERTTLTFTLMVTNTNGPSSTATLTVTVGRSSERALQKTLAAFGRAFAADAVDMISGHLAGNGAATTTNRFTLGGQEIMRDDTSNPEGAALALENQSNPWGDIWQDDNPDINYMSTRALLEKSAFHYTLSDSGNGSGARSVWGRATFGNFEGKPDNLTLDGDLRSAYLGMDYHASEQRQAGVAISYTEGDVDYTDNNANNNSTGNLDAELTSVLPYMRWTTDGGLGVWGLLGYGQGDATLNEDGRDPTETDIEMLLAAAGLRGNSWSLSRTEVSWKASAFAVEMESDAVASQELPSVNAESQRLRLALEGRRTSGKSSGGKWLIPGWELGLRWDNGDAESGAGADLGLGLQYTNPADGWQVQVRSRYLVVHEESDYKEWSASVEARKDFGSRNRGLALTLTPDWNQRESSQRLGLDFSNLINSKWRTDGLRLEVYGERRQRKDDDAPGHEVGLSGELRF